METNARRMNSRALDRIHELRRVRQTIASAKIRKPVHAIGVFHDQNGSIFAIVAASDAIMIARPIQIQGVFNTKDTEDTKAKLREVSSCLISTRFSVLSALARSARV